MKMILAIGFLALGLIGCDDGGGGDEARIRFFNSTSQPGGVSLIAGDETIAVLNQERVSGYTELDEGSKLVRGLNAVTGTELFQFISTFDNDIDYTVFAVDISGRVDPILIVDDNERPDVNNFRIRLVHIAPGVPSVDLYVLREGDTVAGQSPTFSGLDYTEASGYDQIDENEYIAYATLAGTSTVIAQSGVQNFDQFEVWSIILERAPGGGGGLGLVLLQDRGGI